MSQSFTKGEKLNTDKDESHKQQKPLLIDTEPAESSAVSLAPSTVPTETLRAQIRQYAADIATAKRERMDTQLKIQNLLSRHSQNFER